MKPVLVYASEVHDSHRVQGLLDADNSRYVLRCFTTDGNVDLSPPQSFPFKDEGRSSAFLALLEAFRDTVRNERTANANLRDVEQFSILVSPSGDLPEGKAFQGTGDTLAEAVARAELAAVTDGVFNLVKLVRTVDYTSSVARLAESMEDDTEVPDEYVVALILS